MGHLCDGAALGLIAITAGKSALTVKQGKKIKPSVDGKMLKVGKINGEFSDGCMHLIMTGLSSLLCCWLPVHTGQATDGHIVCQSKLVWLFCRQENNASYVQQWMWLLDLMVDKDNLA